MTQRGTGRLPSAARQAGTALLTALVFLLVLTLLGTFGMHRSRLDNRMAGHAQRQALALHNAEYVLAAGEADIEAHPGNPFHPDRPGDHYYPQDTIDFDPGLPGIQQPDDRVWQFHSAHVSLPDVDGDGSDSDGDGIADDGTGRYIIQDAGVELTLNGLPAPSAALAGSSVQAFVVTARSRSAGGAQRTVQSVYLRAPLPVAPGGTTVPRAAGAKAAAPHPAYGRHSWIDLRE